ncbi:hypothetical protein RLJV_24020 [Pseudomonas aeruginosa]|nr:hypothetical protein RLJV_24020 [Pseudomonas aeruginosa]
MDSPLWRDCQLNLKFKDFSAGQRYRLEAGHIGFRPTRLVPLALLLLAGCAGPLPQPDPQMAWVELRSAPANTLLAERLDGERGL